MADKTHLYEDTLEMIETEIEKINRKDELDDKCLDYLDSLVDIVKDIETILAMRNEYGNNGYSQTGRPYYSYDMDGNSYQRRDSRGRYMRNSYDYRNGGYMGNGYSREGNLRSKLEQMINEASTEHERETLRRAIDNMM